MMSIELGKKDIFALMLIVAMADMIFCICFFDWQQNNASRDTKHRTVSLSEDCETDTENIDDFFNKITAIGVKNSEWSSEGLLGDFSQNQNISFRNMICEQIIGEHYIENISMEDIAEHTKLSTSYLSHLFRQELHKNFVDYLTEVRMEQARRLIDQGIDNVNVLAEKVGYQYASYFCRQFKKYTGMTVGEYKRRK